MVGDALGVFVDLVAEPHENIGGIVLRDREHGGGEEDTPEAPHIIASCRSASGLRLHHWAPACFPRQVSVPPRLRPYRLSPRAPSRNGNGKPDWPALCR